MAESDAGAAGMTEQLRRLFPDGTWPEFPWKNGSRRIRIDSDVASPILALIPNWAGDWNDFAPYLRRCGYTPEDLPRVTVKIISAVAAEQAQENMERRASRGLTISGSVGTCTATFTTFAWPQEAVGDDESQGAFDAILALPPRSMQILLVLRVHTATSHATAMKNEYIVECVREIDPTAGTDFRGPYKKLVDLGLKDSGGSCDGGHWLTREGVEAADFIEANVDGMNHVAGRIRRAAG
jgi:hypothetical protein